MTVGDVLAAQLEQPGPDAIAAIDGSEDGVDGARHDAQVAQLAQAEHPVLAVGRFDFVAAERARSVGAGCGGASGRARVGVHAPAADHAEAGEQGERVEIVS